MREAHDDIKRFLAAEGYVPVEPAILQPAEMFLELSGEDIRRRLFITQDANGVELCLRPEYTIPVSRDYLASPQAGKPAAFSYCGPVFRHRGQESGEFPQAGIESFGRDDRIAAEADILALALRTSMRLGLARPLVRMGDLAITHALLDALAVPAAAGRRFLRAVVTGNGTAALTQENPADTVSDYAGLLAAMDGQDAGMAKAMVEDMLAIAGIAQVGGRTASEIAARFLDKARQGAAGISAEAQPILRRYLAIAGGLQESAAALRILARDAGIALDDRLDTFEKRAKLIVDAGIDPDTVHYAAGFARNLDYYTGFMFEVSDPARPDGKPVGGGGRYDNLLTRLGAAEPVPAVGCSLWLDRFGGAGA